MYHFRWMGIGILLMLQFPTQLALSQQTADVFQPPETPLEVSAVEVSSQITIDGRLNESAWQLATGTSDFFRREPRQGGEIRYETFVKFLYDEKNLYVGAFCRDSHGLKGIRVQDLRRDFQWGENDIFGIALDPQNLRQYAQAFQTTPYGNQRDFQNFNGTSFDEGWNTLWNVRTHRTDSGYYAEFAIPFKTLRYDAPEKGEPVEWGVTLVRYARRDIEVSTFPPIPQNVTPYRMTYAAKLTGIKVPPPSANVRIEPYMLYQYDRIERATDPTEVSKLKVGGDAKWAIDPRSVLDITVNTDFAQADVDRAVNNLERFNIFFPEQRQFFLENSGIWAGGLQRSIRPFFSRRIGLTGEFNAAPAPIQAGARYTRRTEKQAIAALLVRQAETEVSPVGNFGVMRYLRNYGSENNIGTMITHRYDQRSNALGLDDNHNTTITIDGQIRPSSEWNIQYLLSTSIDDETASVGAAGRLFAGLTTNQYYFGWLTDFIGAKYNPGMGFVQQNDLIAHNPGGYYIWRPKKLDFIRRWDPGAFIRFNHDASDPTRFQQASLYIFPVYTWFRDNSFIEIAITPTWQNINFFFAPLGLEIPMGRYFYTRYRIRYNTDQSKKWSGGFSYDFGRFYDGRRTTVNAYTRVAPIPHVSFSASYELNDLRNIGENSEDLTAHLVTLGSRLALNPRLQLSAFYQYNSLDTQGRWNVRLSWEYRPLSFVYLVFNDTQVQDALEPFQEQQVVAKITYIKQF